MASNEIGNRKTPIGEDMALSKTALAASLLTIFEDVSSNKTASEKADEMAEVFDDYVKTAIAEVTVPPGTFLIAATAGVLNPLPVSLTGDPDLGTGGLS